MQENLSLTKAGCVQGKLGLESASRIPGKYNVRKCIWLAQNIIHWLNSKRLKL